MFFVRFDKSRRKNFRTRHICSQNVVRVYKILFVRICFKFLKFGQKGTKFSLFHGKVHASVSVVCLKYSLLDYFANTVSLRAG